MRKPVVSAVSRALICVLGGLSGVSYAQQPWAGSYWWVGVGSAKSKSSSSVSFGNDGQTPAVGWSSGGFRGDVYNAVDSMTAQDAVVDMGVTPTNSTFDAPPVWATQLSVQDNQSIGQLIWGVNFQQSGAMLYGLEARANFGSFGASHAQAQSMTTTRTGRMSDFEGASFTFTNYGDVLSGSGLAPSIDNWGGVAYTIPFEQSAQMRGAIKFGAVVDALARVGYASDQWLVYAIGGISQANVKVSTSATITESVSGGQIVGNYPSTTIPVSGEKTYTFSGERSKSRLGFALGVGVQWQIGDGYSMRLEGLRHDFGSMDVTGASSQTQATYSLRQQVKLDQLTMTLVKRF